MSIRMALKFGLVGVVAAGGMALPTSASVDPVPAGDEYYVSRVAVTQNPNANTVEGLSILVTDFQGNSTAPGTRTQTTISSCGAVLGSMDHTAGPNGGSGAIFYFNEAQVQKVGRSIEYFVSITQRAYDPYVRSGSYSGYNVKRPSCEELRDPLRVTWSKKRGVAKIGRSVSVTPTVAPGASVTYTWQLRRPPGTCRKAGCTFSRNIATGRSLKLRPSMRGQFLTVKIRVIKGDFLPKTRVLSFGRVR